MFSKVVFSKVVFSQRVFNLKVVALCCLFSLAGLASGTEQKDPTRPLDYVSREAPQEQQAALQLNSILISSGRKIAIINGKKVAVNERLGNITVAEIHADNVIVYREGERIELKLYAKKLRENATNKVSGR